jgi:hypothetical protein
MKTCWKWESLCGERRMVSSWILRFVTLVGTDVSEELSASFIRVTRIGELGTTLAVTTNRRTLHAWTVKIPLILHFITNQKTWNCGAIIRSSKFILNLNISTYYSVITMFESPSGQRMSWLWSFVVSHRPSRQLIVSTSNWSRPLQ